MDAGSLPWAGSPVHSTRGLCLTRLPFHLRQGAGSSAGVSPVLSGCAPAPPGPGPPSLIRPHPPTLWHWGPRADAYWGRHLQPEWCLASAIASQLSLWAGWSSQLGSAVTSPVALFSRSRCCVFTECLQHARRGVPAVGKTGAALPSWGTCPSWGTSLRPPGGVKLGVPPSVQPLRNWGLGRASRSELLPPGPALPEAQLAAGPDSQGLGPTVRCGG